MKSTSFSRSKQFRYATRALQKDVKFIKKLRVRKDRRSTKIILKQHNDGDKLLYKILQNNGAWQVV